jgi:hypothetical protein
MNGLTEKVSMGTHDEFWRKVAIMVKLNLQKSDASPFRIFDDSEDCLGVPYATAWNWIVHKAKPRKATLAKVLKNLNTAFAPSPSLTLQSLSDETSVAIFAAALGADRSEIADAVLSVEFESGGLSPTHRLAFDARQSARTALSRIEGNYQIIRDDVSSNARRRLRTHLALSVGNILSLNTQHYIHATLVVPSGLGEHYHYAGIVRERSGLLYWVFAQSGVMLDDFVFMISERLQPKDGSDILARGSMITMGQDGPQPMMSNIQIRRTSPSPGSLEV